MEKLKFLTPALAQETRRKFGTPVYVYDERTLSAQAAKALAFPNAFGLTVRYAMKASSNAAILRIFDGCGLHLDASSGWECDRAIRAGIDAAKISLSTQELPSRDDLVRLRGQGIHFNACSLSQLETFGALFPGQDVGVRFNPGVGSGGTSKTNVGGPSSSFGIWHEFIPQVCEIVARHRLRVIRIHTHIGSGSDPAVWQRTAELSIDMVRQFPEVTVLNLGGGYKVGRMAYEKTTDLQEIGPPILEKFKALQAETGRAIKLEIEPGTFLLANSCSLVTTIQDVVHTGADGYHFLKLDAGMTELLRPSLYAAQHPIILLPEKDTGRTMPYVVVGHCCESGDLVTPSPKDHGELGPRELPEVQIGDLCVIEGAGAYCSSMTAKNYNSFPEAAEVLLRENGELVLIRRRQTLEQILQNEVPLCSGGPRPPRKGVTCRSCVGGDRPPLQESGSQRGRASAFRPSPGGRRLPQAAAATSSPVPSSPPPARGRSSPPRRSGTSASARSPGPSRTPPSGRSSRTLQLSSVAVPGWLKRMSMREHVADREDRPAGARLQQRAQHRLVQLLGQRRRADCSRPRRGSASAAAVPATPRGHRARASAASGRGTTRPAASDRACPTSRC